MLSCIFCKIIKGEIPGKFVYRDDDFVAFHDINPKAPVHILVVPVRHIESLIDVKSDDKELLGELILKVHDIAQKLEIAKSGYKLVVNNGEASGQLVFHLHVHLLGGWKKKVNWQV